MNIKAQNRNCLYGVFASEDVLCNDKVIMKKDDLIGVVDSDGQARIKAKYLYGGTCYIRELSRYEIRQLVLMHYSL